MSVYKAKGSENYVYDFQWRGHRFSGATGEKSKRAAEQVEARHRAAAKRDFDTAGRGEAQPMTLDVACQRYWLEVGQHAKNTKAVEWSIDYLLRHLGEDRPVADITDADVASLVARRRGEWADNVMVRRNKTKTPGKRIAAATVNRSVTEPLRRILLRARDVWGKETARITWRRHKLKEPKERVRYLSETEEAALFAVLPSAYHPVVRFALMGGCRANECCGLTWADIDWGERLITIRGKGGKIAPIPLSSDMRQFLWPMKPAETAAAVFRNEAGDPMTYRGFYSAFRRASQRAGIANLRIHDLRHTAATRILSETGNLRLAQELLRHENIATTAKYAHVKKNALREAMEAVARRQVPEKIPDVEAKIIK